jgi:hypothetical protein
MPKLLRSNASPSMPKLLRSNASPSMPKLLRSNASPSMPKLLRSNASPSTPKLLRSNASPRTPKLLRSNELFTLWYPKKQLDYPFGIFKHIFRNRRLIHVNVGEFMVFNATFNNISVISWRSVLLVEVSGVPRENYS